MTERPFKEYLGDAVYADYDGFHVVLTTEDGGPAPSNTIYLDPQVLTALSTYMDRVKFRSDTCKT